MNIAPTQNQLDFIADIEAGIAALQSQDVPINKIKIGQVMTAAGRELSDFSMFIGRLVSQNNWELVLRLKDIFSRVNITPLSITRALEQMPKAIATLAHESMPMTAHCGSEAFKLEPVPLMSVPEAKEFCSIKGRPEREPETEPIPVNAADRVRELIIAELNPMSKYQQERIIGTVARWFGVGG